MGSNVRDRSRQGGQTDQRTGALDSLSSQNEMGSKGGGNLDAETGTKKNTWGWKLERRGVKETKQRRTRGLTVS